MKTFNLRILLFLFFVTVVSELWGQCGTGINIINPSNDTIAVSQAGTNPCGVSPCAELCPNDLTAYVLNVNNAGPGATFSWSFGSGINLVGGTATSSQVTITLSNSSAVNVVVSNGGCSDTFYVELLNTLQAPEVSTLVNGVLNSTASACFGDVINLGDSCTNSSTCTNLFTQWFYASDIFFLNPILNVNSFPVISDTILVARSRNEDFCVTSNSLPISLKIAPIPTLTTNTTNICPGNILSAEVELPAVNNSAIASSGGILSYDWQFWRINGVPGLIDAETNNSVIWQPDLSGSGAFEVRLTVNANYSGNVCGSTVISQPINVRPIIPALATINGSSVDQLGALAVCENTNVNFQALPSEITGASCTNNSPFGFINAPSSGTAFITGCQFQAEYSTISGVVNGTTYRSTLSGGGFITVRSGTFNGPVVQSGNAPLTWTATSNGTYFIHYNTNPSCGQSYICFTSTLEFVSSSSPISNCSGDISMPVSGNCSTCGVNFFDSGGAGVAYSNNENSTFTVYPANPGEKVRVNFSSFDTEACCDRLEIYDGNSTSAPIIGFFSGTNSPGIVTAFNAEGCLTFRFTSNSTQTNPGWQASFSCVTASRYSYAWSRTGTAGIISNLSSFTQAPNTVPFGTYNYTVTVTDNSSQCSASDGIQLAIKQIPVISNITANGTLVSNNSVGICNSQDVEFIATTTSAPTISNFEWDLFDSGNNPWQPFGTFTFVSGCPACFALGQFCSFWFNGCFVQTPTPPLGSSGSVNCGTPCGNTYLTTDWLNDGIVTVRANATNGCTSDLNTVNLNITPAPVVAINLASPTVSNTVCPNTTDINLSASSTSTITPLVWRFLGDTIVQSTFSCTIPRSVLANNSGTNDTILVEFVYRSDACELIETFPIIIKPAVIVNLPAVSNQCNNNQFSVTALAVSQTGTVTYNWTASSPLLGPSGPVGQTWQSSLTVPNATYGLTVTAQDPGGCSGTASTSIVVDLCNSVSIVASSNFLCEGQNLEVKVLNYTIPAIQTNATGLVEGEACLCSVNPCTSPSVPADCPTIQDGSCVYSRSAVYVWTSWDGSTQTSVDEITIPISNLTPDTFTVYVAAGYQDIVYDKPDAFSSCIQRLSPVNVEPVGSKLITVSRPRIQIQDTVRTCIGSALNLQASCLGCQQEANYLWSVSPGNFANIVGSSSSSTGPNYTTNTSVPSISSSQVYIVTVTDGYNCTSVASLPAAIIPPLGSGIATAQFPTTPQPIARYCPTSSVTLIAVDTIDCTNCIYNWSTGQNSQTITVNQPGTVILSLQKDNCIETSSILVTPFPTPTPEIKSGTVSSSTYYMCNAPITLNADTLTCRDCLFTWNTGANTNSIQVGAQGGFYVQAIDTNGCIGYSSPVMVLNSPVGSNNIVTASPSALCNGQTVQLVAQACVGCTYEWYDAVTNIQVPQVSSTRITTISNPGSYYAMVTNQNGCRYPTNIVNVSSVTVTTPSIGSSTNILCSGSSANLFVNTLPSYQAYQWYRNGSIISGATNPTYNTTQTGTYYCAVTYSSGCRFNSNARIISSGTFSPEANATNSVVCQGETVNISTATNPGWTYQWYRNGVLISGATGAAYDASLPGNYYVRVTTNFGCTNNSNIVELDESTITSPNASASTQSICRGEATILGVTLCPGCSYQWYDAISGNPLNPISSPSNFNYQTTTGGRFFVQVNNGFCFGNSDTLTITELPVITPPINTNSLGFVCNGVNPRLFTQNCAGCNYTWLRDTAQIFGALNDTSYTVSNVLDTGLYQVVVTYPNGCRDTSAALTISDGTYDLFIAVDTAAADSLVCNGSNVLLEIDNVNSSALNCNLGCTYSWIRNGVPIPLSNAPTYTINQGGVYSMVMIDSRGCQETALNLNVDEVTLNPTLTANPTIICGTQPVTLTASICPGCSYEWYYGSSPIISVPSTTTTINTDSIGIYYVDVTQNGCTARSPLVSVNQVSSLSIPIMATDSNVCAGDTVSLFRVGGGCTNCTFQWLLNNAPITAATTPNYITNIAGSYRLEMTILGSNCKDTSAPKVLADIPPPAGFALDLAGAGFSTLASTAGSQVNLYNAVVPAYLGTATSGFFYSQPFNAALNANSGMHPSPDFNLFNSDTSGSGFHRIYYQFDTAGCNFVATDILFVLDEPNVTIRNENNSAPLYEACVADTIVLTVNGLDFKIDSVYLFDANNNYVRVPIANDNLSSTVLGGVTVWNGTIRLGIPDNAYSSFMLVTSAGNVDSFVTPFLLIHNTNLDISGLPGVVCSANPPLQLTGTPAGGFFTAQYFSGGTLTQGTLVSGAFTGNNFNTGAMTRASYGNDMVQNVRVVYNYFNSFTNGIGCPQVDTISQFVEARGVFLDAVRYNPISVSQDRELLSNLVFRVTPYQSQPSWLQDSIGGSISFSGNFTFPAGNPVDFLPKNAGVGKHAMTYRITNGICTNQLTDSIQVIAAPNGIGIPDSMCRTQTFANFGRQTGLYSYFDGAPIGILPGINFQDTVNIIRVYSTNGPNTGLTVVNPNLNLEQYNYNPTAVVGNLDTLKVEYWYKKVERINNVPVDTVMYIVGSIVTPIYIEDPFTVDIIDTIVSNVYCEVDQLYLLAGSPSGGSFTLQGGTGAYSTAAPLVNNILNPFTVHSPENSTTVYNLTYTRTGAVCQNSDTKQITIPEPMDPTFGTASGKRIFCKTDPTENIVISATGNFSGQWLINGITQPTYTISPLLLNPGNQVVTNIITDTIFGCVYTAVDTYRVNALPVLSVNPLLDAEYCTNDPNDTIRVSPNPICAQFVTGGLTMLVEGFNAPAFPWNRQSIGTGNSWIRTTSNTYLNSPGVAFVNTSNDVENTWMFTPNQNLTTGHTYLITLYALAGNCVGSPCPNPSFKVTVGQGQTIASQLSGTEIADTFANPNVGFYQQYLFSYTHTGLSGNYNFGFQCYSGVNAPSLSIDDITIVDGSVSGCVLGGTGTMVGPGINYMSDSSYVFNPRIVAPGNYNIRYVYTAAETGCTDSIQMPILVKPHPLPSFTNLNPQYCDNASAVILVPTLSPGTFTSNGPNLVTTPFIAYDPAVGIINEIVSYTHQDLQTQCITTVSDTVSVISIADSAKITGVDTAGYCYNVDSVLLNVSSVAGDPDTVMTGYFYGFGVRKGQQGPGIATFYPDSAVLDAGRYGDFVITYVYPTLSGCFDTAKVTTSVHAMPDISFDFMVPSVNRLPDSICLNADTVFVRVNNHVITGNLGEIEYDILLPIGPFNGGSFTPSLGLQDTLNPVRFGVGWHNIAYNYTDVNGCSASIRDSFRIDTVPVIRFAGLQPDRIYCENEAPSLLLAYPPYYPGSGYLQLTSGIDSIIVDSSFYLINPSVFADSTNPNKRWDIYYTFEDLNFCSNSGVDSFFMRPYPRITMALPPTFCSSPTLERLMPYVNPQGGIFTDNLVISDIAQDTMLYLDGSVGPRQITYYYTDQSSTCSNNAAQTVSVYSTPDFDFYALGGCVGATITFVSDTNNLDVNIDSISRIEWIFGDGNNVVNNSPPDSIVPNQTHVYANDSIYRVSLLVTNQGLCSNIVTRQLVVSPFVNNYPYLETFQTGTAGWYQEEPIIVADSLAVWQRAELIGNNINDPANFAWVTKPNAPFTYNTNERAWVYSPCFDFTNARRPMIAFDIWRDFLTDIDGAVLEFYDDFSNTWKPVGETEKGINWYQTNFLVSRPGNQAAATYPRGWTGESAGWEKARYRLDYLTGRPFLRFRVAFASDPNTVLEGHEGMAFDSVWIGERGRNVLVEHFSNFFHFNQQGASMDIIDKKVYDSIYNSINGRDVSLIQYQTNIQQVDPVNALFSFDFDSRVLYYGINANSQIRIDGLTYGNGRSENLSQYHMDFDMLQFPVFDIQVDPLIFSGNTIQVNAEARALTNLDSADYTMTFAITEDDVFNNRGFAMQSVLRKFIPDASGFSLQQGWTAGQIVNRSGSWIYNLGTPDPSKIEAVVFIQNNNTKDVMQVATTRDLSIFPPVGSIPLEEEAAVRRDIIGMNLFPNPAQNYFNVSFDLPLSSDYQWALVDVLGRVVNQGIARERTEQMIIDTEKLSEGTYFFTIRNDNAYAQRKVVITKQ